MYTDPAQYIITSDTGSAVDDLDYIHDLYDLDRDLSEV